MKGDDRTIDPSLVRGVGIGICVLITAAGAGSVAFFHQRAAHVEKSMRQKNVRVVALNCDVKRLQDMISNHQAERKELERLLFTEDDIAAFLRKIGDFGRSAGIRIVDMKAQDRKQIQEADFDLSGKKNPMVQKSQAASPPVKPDPAQVQIMYLPIQMTLEGTFGRIVNFLVSLENYRQVLTLSEVSLRRSAYPVLTCQFTLQLYSLKHLNAVVQ